MRNQMNWDELNIIRDDAVEFIREAKKQKPRPDAVKGFCDYLEFVLCLIYDYGWKDAEQIVGVVPFKDGLDDKAVNLEVKGETFRDRVQQQIEDLSEDGLLRIIDTEAHRDYNTGIYDAAKQSGKPNVMKRWVTMRDDRVRETHDYLEGTQVGLDDYFYTFDGDQALAPGGFTLAENNVNCRCFITLST